MREVFISYKSGGIDETVANELCQALEAAAGITCWMAPRDIPFGSNYDDCIEEAIETCKVVLVVFSQHTLNSQYFYEEIRIAYKKGKEIILFKLDHTQLTDKWGIILDDMACIDATGDYRQKIPALINNMKRKIKKAILEAQLSDIGVKQGDREPIVPAFNEQETASRKTETKAFREVFISYKSEETAPGIIDETVAKELCQAIEAAGITCWMAPGDIEPGVPYSRAIMEAINNCKAMVVVFSKNSNISRHIASEVDVAFSKSISIIPFNIDGSKPSLDLDYYLRRMQWINASGSYRPRIPELITALRNKLGKTGQNVYRDAPSSAISVPVTQNIYIDAPTEHNTTPVTPNVLNFTVNGVSFKMIRVEGGTFTMGATTGPSDGALDREYPAHEVMLSTYYIGETLVTQKLWQAVMVSNPSRFVGDLNRPVECVSWSECQEFLKRLNEMTGRCFRLPTEAEWEFAARGGNKSGGYRYAGSDKLDEVAWYDGNSDNEPHPVAAKSANELGIYDMLGNLWEWCQDWYDDYSPESQTNPTGPNEGYYHVSRGGSWKNDASFCRMSFRGGNNPSYKWDDRGLRLAL